MYVNEKASYTCHAEWGEVPDLWIRVYLELNPDQLHWAHA